MKYKGEMFRNGRVVSQGYFDGTHPKEVVRKILKNKKPMNSLIYIVNEYGELWAYSIKNNNGKYFVRPMKSKNALNQDDLDLVFMGKKKIIDFV